MRLLIVTIEDIRRVTFSMKSMSSQSALVHQHNLRFWYMKTVAVGV